MLIEKYERGLLFVRLFLLSFSFGTNENKHEIEIIGMKSEFVSGSIEAMNEEKDPRNLAMCFQIAQFILSRMRDCIADHIEVTLTFRQSSHFSLSCLTGLLPLGNAKDLFDVTSCYFPITFSAPKTDPYGISGDQLRQGLRSVIL
jgi:DNA repair/transcription protein MET18/MMS19